MDKVFLYNLRNVFFRILNRIPNTFRRLFSEGTFNAAFVPLYSAELTKGKTPSQKFANEIYNISGHQEQKNIVTVEKIIESYGHNTQDIDQYVDLSYSRQGQDVRYSVDDSKLQSLGWAPEKRFNDEIDDIVTHYKNNFIW